MFANKGLICAALAAGVFAVAQQPVAAGTLVNDLAAAQLEKQIREATKSEEKPKAPSTVMPNLPIKESGKKLTLVAVYGLGDRLMADIGCQGAVFSVKKLDVVDGWTVKNIWPTRLILEKKRQTKELTLAIRPAEMAGGGIAGPMPAGMVPPPPM